jgi:molybdopterin molybdotransferase
MISFTEARERILSEARPLGIENCRLSDLLGRVLAQDIVSSFDIPPRDNSAMDGFAVRQADIAAASPKSPMLLEVIEDVPAGTVATRAVGQGQAIRIMTGAQIPQGANCVVPVENIKYQNSKSKIQIEISVEPGENIRRRGEDVRAGEVLIPKGARLRPQEVGLIASLGMAGTLVSEKPVVGIVSSGNEIVNPGKPLGPGQIYDANRYSLGAQAREVNAEVRDYGIVEDDLGRLAAVLQQAAAECQLILTSGGVSVGDYDLMKQALAKLGRMHFWQVAQKPGKPLAFGHIQDCPVIGLPGNPVSSMVIFEQYVRPFLLKMQGAARLFREQLTGVSQQRLTKPAGRREFLRIKAEWQDGGYQVRLTGPQGSGILTSMVRADGLMILAEEVERVDIGDRVIIELFGGGS